MSIEFLLTSMIVILLPGTGMLYTVGVSLALGWRKSVAAAVGCTFGIVPSILAAVFGLAVLLHTSALAFQVLKYFGVAYLLYLAFQTLREKGPIAFQNRSYAASSFALARTGMLINILNPKLTVFFLAFLPQFVTPGAANATLDTLVLGVVFMAMTFVVFIAIAAMAAMVRGQVLGSRRVMAWLRRGFAFSFAALAIKLAVAEK